MRKFLIVDDSKVSRVMVRKALKDLNVEYQEADNGQSAVDFYRAALEAEVPYDLVICDITMDIMDGMEAAEKILGMDASASVIMLSALKDKDSMLKCIDLGVRDYLTKPFQASDLRTAVSNALAGGKAEIQTA